MSNYIFQSSLSYYDYLQAKSFVGDITEGQLATQHVIENETRKLIATHEELHEQNMSLMESGFATLASGCESISMKLSSTLTAIEDLNASFHWGFSNLLTAIGGLGDNLSQLLAAAKNPAQNWAFNQYEIARDAIRKQLYPEALESLERAINGFGDHPGYKIDYRFHLTKGTLHLGAFDNIDRDLLDLPMAERCFLAATRYARVDAPSEAALALLQAGWACYCQGKMDEALQHTKDAVALRPRFSEAHFQIAKISSHQGQLESSYRHLREAILIDRNYSIKAASDDDFHQNNKSLYAFLDGLKNELKTRAEEELKTISDEIRVTNEWKTSEVSPDEVKKAVAFFEDARVKSQTGTLYGFLDVLTDVEKGRTSVERSFKMQKVCLQSRAHSLISRAETQIASIESDSKEHSPALLSRAFQCLSDISKQKSSPQTYNDWKNLIERAEEALKILEKLNDLNRQRADKCREIKKRNDERIARAGEISFEFAFFVYVLSGIGLWIMDYVQTTGNEKINALVLGWLGGGILGLPIGLVVWLISYFAIKGGHGKKPYPPQN